MHPAIPLGLGLVALLALRPARAAPSGAGVSDKAPELQPSKVVTVAGKPEPRGIRNNNPGNLRDAGIPWQGRAGRDELGYLIFEAHPDYGRAYWGIRAMVRDLLDDHVRDGLRTVRALITEYAPHSENPTEAYIAHVSKALGVSPDAPIDLQHDRRQLDAFVRAAIYQENGVQPYSQGELAAGIDAGLQSFRP